MLEHFPLPQKKLINLNPNIYINIKRFKIIISIYFRDMNFPNDWIQDFIDSNLKITVDINHRIAKQDMFDAIRNEFPNRHMSNIQIIDAMKDKKIDYNAKFRCDKTQGCFVGILFQTPHDEVLNNYEFKLKFEDALARIQALETEMKKLINLNPNI